MKLRKPVLIIIFCIGVLPSLAQRPELDKFLTRFHEHENEFFQEKIFLHLDRTFYMAGETIWLKAYLVDGYVHQPVASSKVAYVEILNASNEAIAQLKIELQNGMGTGSIELPATINSGNFQVRAYTNWMKNFGPEFFFHQPITIINPFRTIEASPGSNTNLDIQFFPEGGTLLTGVESHVAFRVVNADGKGVDFNGYLVSGSGDTLVRFKPWKFGLGKFKFTPSAADSYKVIIKEKNGSTQRTELGPPSSAGYAIQVSSSTDSFEIQITGKGKEVYSPMIYLIGHTRQVIKIAEALTLREGQVTIRVPKSSLGDGISHFTVFNSEFKPVCERLVFIKPATTNVQVTTDQESYGLRSRIKLALHSELKSADSLQLSISVHKNDSLKQFDHTNIPEFLWLTSDLKGTIESPRYYFSDAPDVAEGLDNLMLTHGWSRFRWEDLRDASVHITYLPEYRGHLIYGKVLSRDNSNPLSNVLTYLAWPQKRIQFAQAISNDAGTIRFETNQLKGRQKLFIQPSQADSLARIELTTPFFDKFTRAIPNLELSKELTRQLTTRSISMQVLDAFKRNLQTTIIRSDSSAFYGRAQEEYKLDDYTRFPLMEEVMREYVKGVRVRKREGQFIFKILNTANNTVFDQEPLVLLDGVPLMNVTGIMEFDPLKIKQLDVITNKYFFGSQTYEGIVSYRTYQGDLGGYVFTPHTIVLDYEGLQAAKEFFAPKYETKQQLESRVPDARTLLHWAPDINLSKAGHSIEFYSSDQPGRYDVVIQGISASGLPVYQRSSFTVKR